MPFSFSVPVAAVSSAVHHSDAAIRNVEVTTNAIGALQDVLDGVESYERLLLKAAAGAGKSFALRRLVRGDSPSGGDPGRCDCVRQQAGLPACRSPG